MKSSDNQERIENVTVADVGSTAMLSPVDLDTLCAELLKRYGAERDH